MILNQAWIQALTECLKNIGVPLPVAVIMATHIAIAFACAVIALVSWDESK